MARLKARRAYQKRLLESIGNKSPEELGKLAMDMMRDIDTIYSEAGVDDSAEDEFDYDFSRSQRERELEDMYGRMREEYHRRFAGLPVAVDSTTPQIPGDEPMADDMTIGIDPHTGVEVVREGNGIEELVSESDIFG